MCEYACTYASSLSWHSVCVSWFHNHRNALQQHIGCLGTFFKQNLKTVDEPCELVDELILDPVSKQPIVYFLRIKPVKISFNSIIHNLTIGFIGNVGIFTNIKLPNGENLVSDTTHFTEIEAYLESLNPIDTNLPIAISILDDQQLIPALNEPTKFTNFRKISYDGDHHDGQLMKIASRCKAKKSCVQFIDDARIDEPVKTESKHKDSVLSSSSQPSEKHKRRRKRFRRPKQFAIVSRTFGAANGLMRFDVKGQLEQNAYMYIMQMRSLRHDSMPYD